MAREAPGLATAKTVLGILFWLLTLVGATFVPVVVGWVDPDTGAIQPHVRVWASVTLAAALLQVVLGVFALRGRVVPAWLWTAGALAPWIAALAPALARLRAPFEASHWSYQLLARSEHDPLVLLYRACSAAAALWFGVCVITGLVLLRARPPRSPLGSVAATLVALAAVIGAAPAIDLGRRFLAGAGTGQHDAYVVFLPAWIVAAILTWSVARRFAGEPPADPVLRSARDAFVVSLWAPVLWGLSSVTGALGALDLGPALDATVAERAATALRLRALGLACHLVAAALLLTVASRTLRPRRSVALAAAAGWASLAALSGLFLARFDAAVAYSTNQPAPPAAEEHRGLVLPLAPPGTLPVHPNDADRAMAAVREPPPPVPELAPKTDPRLLERQRDCWERHDPKSCVAFAQLAAALSLTRAPLVLAAAALDRGCRAKDPTSCGRLGLHLLRSWGVVEDIPRGKQLLEAACRDGSDDACGLLGTQLAWGQYLPPEWERGRELSRRACNRGVWHACVVLSRTVRNRDERPHWARLARRGAEAGCRLGDVQACQHVDYAAPHAIPGGELLFDRPRYDLLFYVECKKELPLTCELAQLTRSWQAACSKGTGETCDSKMPASILESGCRAGSWSACEVWVGQAAPGSSSRTTRMQEACHAGHVLYCTAVVDEGTPAWVAALEGACPAIALSSQRRELDPSACERAARAHLEGKIVPKNVGRALELYRRGCWENPRYPSHKACITLAELFLHGDGVPRDVGRAMTIFASHCGAEGKESCRKVAEHLKRLAPDHETQYQRERREWLER